MKCLVTGGAGFIGSHTVDLLIDNGHEVIIVDNFLTSDDKNLNSRAKIYKTDITSEKLDSIFKKELPNVVYHLAAQPAINISMKDPMLDADINILGTINVLEKCVKYNVNKIIFSSSGSAVYGNIKPLPATEISELKPISIYGQSKLSAESYIQLYSRIYDLDYIILRYSDVYGPRQDLLCEEGIIPLFIDKMMNEKDPEIYGDGKQTRDYIYVDDVIKANILALDYSGKEKIFNISSSVETSINDIFVLLKDAMFEFIDHEYIAHYKKSLKKELRRVYLDNYLAKRKLKWSPETSLKEGIKKTVAYFIEQLRK